MCVFAPEIHPFQPFEQGLNTFIIPVLEIPIPVAKLLTLEPVPGATDVRAAPLEVYTNGLEGHHTPMAFAPFQRGSWVWQCYGLTGVGISLLF